MYIDHDLENSPLQIKTNSEVGSNEAVVLWFYTAQQVYAGGIYLYFCSSPQYWLYYCSTSFTKFPTDLPSETDKVWTITLTRSSGKKRVVIHCNDKEVLNVVFSNTTCSDSMWSNIWSRDVKKIEFDTSDTASDFYRPGIVLVHMLDLKETYNVLNKQYERGLCCTCNMSSRKENTVFQLVHSITFL